MYLALISSNSSDTPSRERERERERELGRIKNKKLFMAMAGGMI